MARPPLLFKEGNTLSRIPQFPVLTFLSTDREENRGQTGEFPFFQSKKSLIGKKGIHQSDPDFPSDLCRRSQSAATVCLGEFTKQAIPGCQLLLRGESWLKSSDEFPQGDKKLRILFSKAKHIRKLFGVSQTEISCIVCTEHADVAGNIRAQDWNSAYHCLCDRAGPAFHCRRQD